MKRTIRSAISIALITLALITGCALSLPAPATTPGEVPNVGAEERATLEPTAAAGQSGPAKTARKDVTAWAVYWDTEKGLAELAHYPELEALCYFEAYFNGDEQLTLPNEIPALYRSVREKFPEADWISYLTFVNDKLDGTGKSSLKDTALLENILKDEAAIDRHVEDVIRMAAEEGFDGIEIDYEAIRKNIPLFERFLSFCEKLYARSQEEGLALRVLLEPGTPFDSLTFPKGPNYVMMCYNLYGTHSGPGPKADAAFIRKLMNKMAKLPGRKDFAIATGGFDWCGGKAKAVTEEGAKALIKENTIISQWRDEESRAMVFTYRDESGSSHVVWYADQTTLDFWAEIIRAEGGDGISLWRLGGNAARLK